MKSGVYAIEHTASGRRYIGSASNFDARWRVHRCLLRKGKHHAPHLQSAWDKYGEPAFEFRPLLICSKENMLMYEQKCLDVFRPFDRERGFNVALNAKACRLGIPHTKESKAKMSRSASNRQPITPEHSANLSASRKGRKMPPGFSEALGKRMLGFKHTAETRAKMSVAKTGIKPSLATVEAKAKLTMAQATEIRMLFASGQHSQASLAKSYGVHQSHISRLVRGRYWPTDRT